MEPFIVEDGDAVMVQFENWSLVVEHAPDDDACASWVTKSEPHGWAIAVGEA